MRKLRTKNKNLFLIALLLSSTFLSITSLTIVNVTASIDFIPTPDQPNENVYWNFDNDTLIGWRADYWLGSEYGGTFEYYFNISSTSYIKNYSGEGINWYSVQLTYLEFNTSTNSLEPLILPGSSTAVYNYSLTNFTTDDFIPFDQTGGGQLMVAPFIPTNGTEGLLLQWCAERLTNDYFSFIGNDLNPIITYSGNTTRFENSTGSGEYIETVYFDNGTLKTAEIYTYGNGMFPEGYKVNYTRIYDFNPLDDLEWSVEKGDDIYYGFKADPQTNEFQLKIVDIINRTSLFMGMFPIALQEIKANISYWDNISMSWQLIVDNETIGIANELYAIYMFEMMGPKFICPIGTTGEDLFYSISIYMAAQMYTDIEYSYDAYSLYIRNATGAGEGYMEVFNNGRIKYMWDESVIYPVDMLLFYKNSTIINGDYDFDIEPYGEDEFDVHVNMSVTEDTHLLFAALDCNPSNTTLEEALLFIDLFLNNTDNLQGLVNITIMYDDAKFRDLNMWWFDMAADGGRGEWVNVPFTDLGGGTLEVLVDYVSFFALTGNSRPGSFILDTNATVPDTDGIFDLYWESAIRANTYSVYESDAPITTLTGSETLLASEIKVYEIPIVKAINDEYYYVVTANNDDGITLSNCILVDVQIPPTPPGDFTLSTNADDPDDDGDFNLSWTLSAYAINYTVYQYSGYITEINGSLTTLSEEMTTRTLSLTGYTNGTYYFIVVATNTEGETLSNCIHVVVAIPPEDGDGDGDGDDVIPGYPLYLLLTFFVVITSIIIKKKRKKLL